MQPHSSTTPFGRRSLTLAQVANQAVAKARPPDKAVRKWQVFRAICTAKSSTVGCVAKVTIQAIGLSRDIHADKGPLRGRVIGQIRNLDPQDMTEMDSLKPSSQMDYYIYIDSAPSGRARWNLLEVPNVREGIIRRIVQEEVKQCGEKQGFEWRRSDVDFANCGDHYLQNLSRAEMLSGD